MGDIPPLTPAAKRVLETAGELFYAHGINTVGMDRIAAQAGVTKKTVYDRFGSKQDLVVAYLRDRDDRWRRWLTERLDANDGPHAKILATFDALDEWMSRNHRGCAMLNAYAELSDPHHPGRQVAQDQKAWLWRLYADLSTEAGIVEVDLVADQLLILHEGATVAAFVGGRRDAAAAARTAAAAALRTLPGPPAAA